MKFLPLILAASLAACAAAAEGDDKIYTLYRTTPSANPPPHLNRIHMGTFDADHGEDYNRENCQIAADLFQQQPGVTVRYWCEKGRYRR